MTNLEQAAKMYKTRRFVPPFGYGVAVNWGKGDIFTTTGKIFKHKGPIWYPKPEETRDCCRKIKPPSRYFPFNYLNHVKTIGHIAKRFNVDYFKLKDEIKVTLTDGEFEKTVLRKRLKEKRKRGR